MIPDREGEVHRASPFRKRSRCVFKHLTLCLLVLYGIVQASAIALSSEPEQTLDPTEISGSVAISIQEAIALALQRTPGTAILAELVPMEEQAVWEIEIVTPQGEVQEIFVDAQTGTVRFSEDSPGSELLEEE